VHGAGIVGDDELGAFEEGGELLEGGAAGEVDCAGEVFGHGGGVGAAGEYDFEAEALFQGRDQLGEFFHGPAFGFPVGAGEEHGVLGNSSGGADD
jgi:hypothetical protein